MGESKSDKNPKRFKFVIFAVVAQILLFLGGIAYVPNSHSSVKPFLFRLWQNPHVWCTGADDFRKKICPDSMESFELAVTRSLTAARLYAEKTKNEYHYRFVQLHLES